MNSIPSDLSFGIGAVSRLTGIPMDTLRIWERRYGAIKPMRAGRNRRFYSREDISRLILIKQLVDRGNPVSSVVRLGAEELTQKLSAYTELELKKEFTPEFEVLDRPAKVLILGDALPYQILYWLPSLSNLELLGHKASYAEFESLVLKDEYDLLILEFPTIESAELERIRELGQRAGFARILVVYAFASKTFTQQLSKLAVNSIRAPVSPRQLDEYCHAWMVGVALQNRDFKTLSIDDDVKERRYNGEVLAAIAEYRTTVECECPQHLVDLLSRISAFEQYSLGCENRNEADAALHAELHRYAGRVRTLLEEAMDIMIVAENIQLDTYLGIGSDA